MRLSLALPVLASAAIGFAAAEEHLKIDVTLPVECDRKTQKGDRVSMHYRGRLASNDKEFDASYKRNTPFSFTIGTGQVIKGWDEGLLDMCIGERRTLTISPEKGYGKRNVGPIPAGSTLIFETELIDIENLPKPETIKTKTATDTATTTVTEVIEEASQKVEEAEGKVGEKIAEKVGEAADAVKTLIMDSDDTQEHNEL